MTPQRFDEQGYWFIAPWLLVTAAWVFGAKALGEWVGRKLDDAQDVWGDE